MERRTIGRARAHAKIQIMTRTGKLLSIALIGVAGVLPAYLFLKSDSPEEIADSTGTAETESSKEHLQKKDRPTQTEEPATRREVEPFLADASDRDKLKQQGTAPADPVGEARARPLRQQDPAYIEQVIDKALHDATETNRIRALAELGFIGARPEIVKACIQALQDRHERVREEAALTLESLEDRSAIPALKTAAEGDHSESVREAAQEAVEYLERVTKSPTRP